jgi:hypothetical protein
MHDGKPPRAFPAVALTNKALLSGVYPLSKM